MGRKKKSRQYFGHEVDEAICLFQKEASVIVKQQIYVNKIQEKFIELILGVINAFKFYEIEGEDVVSLKIECEGFLYSKLEKFDKNKGKAFSYFSTICKRYLIQKNLKKKIDIYRSNRIQEIIEFPNEFEVKPQEDCIIHNEKFDYILNRLEKYIENKEHFQTEKDLQIADAIVLLLKQRKELEFYNKKYIYALIRNITDAYTPAITNVLKGMISEYASAVNDFDQL